MPSQIGSPSLLLPLLGGEVELTDGQELYFRQCNPQHFKNNQPSDLMFNPSSSDGGKLSGSRSTKTTAKDSFDFRSAQKPGATIGTWCVSVGEAGSIGSRVIDDTRSVDAPPAPIPPGHVYLDLRSFHALSSKERRTVRSTLLIASLKWGRQHPI